jgi:hypothetical protein
MGGERASTARLRLARQDLLQLQDFSVPAAHARREILHEVPVRFGSEAEGLSTLHVANRLALPIPGGEFENALPKKFDVA